MVEINSITKKKKNRLCIKKKKNHPKDMEISKEAVTYNSPTSRGRQNFLTTESKDINLD